MTPTPPSTTTASPDNAQFRVVRKRNRVPLSCAPCRNRKLKCNRGHPCDNCTKRGDTGSCSYAAPSVRKKGGSTGPNGTPDDMQNRIDRLEGLVLSLMTNGPQGPGVAVAQAALDSARSSSVGGASANTSSLDADGESMMKDDGEAEDDDVNDVSQQMGIMKVDNGKSMFVSEAHWYSILSDIAEVKNYFASHKEQYDEQKRRVDAAKSDDALGANFLFKAPRLSDRAEVMASLPSKPVVDRLVARYFNSYDPSMHLVHGPLFQSIYTQHWQNPSESSLVFIAMLYAIMSLALQSYHRASDEPPEYRGRSLEISVSYRRLTAQTLALADITQPVPQVLEVLCLHLQAEFARSRDAETGILVLLSIIVRLAMRMGYHRDPDPYPNITPFQAEIRRRVWVFIRQADLLLSFQFGLPAMIRSDCTDTKLPRNLYDNELTEEMRVLPPSRPITEATSMSYMVTKANLAYVFAKVAERVASVTEPPSYEETMDLDAQLRAVRNEIPHYLQIKPLEESMQDPANLIMQRLGMELLYLKSQCVLHRRFIARGRESARYAYSRRTCIDASMDMLAHQATIHHESQPGGRLHSIKWYFSSLSMSDFTLAAMIVCLDLHHCAEAERSGRKPSQSPGATTDIWAQDRRDQMMNALHHAVSVWSKSADESMEAWKAASTLSVMLERLIRQSQQSQQSPQRYPNPQSAGQRYPNYGIFPNANLNMSDDVAPEHSAAMTLGLLSSGGVSPNPGFNGSGSVSANTATSSSAETRGYPASMAGLLNEPLPERTGLTPQYTGPDGSAMNAPSPFTQLMSGGTGGLDGGEIDWSAWDSYIQGSTDPLGGGWPNMDMNAIDPQIQNQGQTAANTFMGAATPQGTI